MDWFSRMIGRKVEAHLNSEAFTDALAGHVKRVALEELRKDPVWLFVKHAQAAFQERDPSLSDKKSHLMAVDLLNGFLRDEKVKFRDPRFTWDAEAARTLAHEEMSHWEYSA